MYPLLCPGYRCIVSGLVAAAMSVNAGLALAQTNPSPESARSITQALLTLNAQSQAAGLDEQAGLESVMLTLAASRQQLLASLIESDPGEVLRIAMPAALRASLPPAVQASVEEEVELEGVLDVLHEDWPTGSVYRYFLDSVGSRFSLHFAADPPTHLLTGARIRVRGVQIGTMLALGGSTSVQTVAPAPLPNSFGAQRTLVILVNFQGAAAEPYTPAYASGVIFGTTSNFILENSYGQTWMTGDVVGWYTIPLSSTVCDTSGLGNYANSAATAAGVNLSAYSHLIYAFPANACPFWGSASVGGNPSRAYINGRLELAVTGHEFGHNLGLQHSHSWAQCPNNTIIGDCYQLEYGDGLDIMGWSHYGHFNAPQKERLGWLNYGVSPPITTVTSSGMYTLAPLETIGTAPKALKILKYTNPTTGVQDWYYVEFRQALGFDSDLATTAGAYQMLSSNILNGVEIRWVPGSQPASGIRLLDMTPGSIDPYSGTVDLYTNDPALTVGNSFSDPDAGVTITTSSAAASGATMTVTLTTPTCARANPTVTASPATQAAPAGSTVSYTISVTNNDGAGCAPATFDVDIWTFGTIGWSMALGASSCSGDTHCAAALSLNPGDSATVPMTMTSAPDATGSFGFPVTATNRDNGSYGASTSPIYTIGTTTVGTTGTTLSVSVSTDKPSYTGNQSVSVTARASSGGSPVSNASVTFTITKADGTVASQTAITDSTGSAVAKYRLTKSDPGGGYRARADAAKTPLSGSASTSFMVK